MPLNHDVVFRFEFWFRSEFDQIPKIRSCKKWSIAIFYCFRNKCDTSWIILTVNSNHRFVWEKDWPYFIFGILLIWYAAPLVCYVVLHSFFILLCYWLLIAIIWFSFSGNFRTVILANIKMTFLKWIFNSVFPKWNKSGLFDGS